MENEFSQPLSSDDFLFLFKNTPEETSPEPKGDNTSNGQDSLFLLSFLTELIHCMKGNLLSIKNFASVPIDHFDSLEFRKHFQASIEEDVKKIDSVLNTLLNYISISTPLMKTNTLRIILEEILEANEKRLRDRKIRIFKECDENLPETYMHHEQVRFVLNSILQYALLVLPSPGSIGFSIKYTEGKNGASAPTPPLETNGGHIEMTIGFSGERKMATHPESSPDAQRDEANDLILKLVAEIVEKNKGTIKFVANERGQKSLVILRLQIERRKRVHYEPINM
jgi:hypothetical protein